MTTPHHETPPNGKHFKVEEIFDKAPATSTEETPAPWCHQGINDHDEADPWNNQPVILTEARHESTILMVFKELLKSLFKVIAFAAYTLAAGPFIIPPLFTAITGEPSYVESLSEQSIEVILMTMFYMACCYSVFAAVMCLRRLFKISRSSRVAESAPTGTVSLEAPHRATEA